MVDGSAVGMTFPLARARVEPDRLNRFLDTLGETNPVYRDAEAAIAAGFDRQPIPPTWLFCLEMIGAGGRFAFLDALGIDLARLLHGEQSFVYHAPVYVDDELTFRSSVTDVRPKKGGALTLIDITTRVTNQHDEAVADLIRVMAVRNPSSTPARGGARATDSSVAAQVADRAFAKTFPRIARETLARYADASGDPNPIHLDSAFARAAGFPDVFAHGMLVMGLVGQALTGAMSPRGLRAFSTRFVAITPVGAVIACEGTVAGLFEAEGERRARIALCARDEDGELKLAGEALVAL